MTQDVHYSEHCSLCQIDEANVVYQNDFGLIMYDQTPVTKGHCLVLPHRHVSSFFEVTDKERKSLISLIEQARNELKMIYQPSGFHVSFGDGDVNGQPIEHLHIHILPRYHKQPLKLDQRWGAVINNEVEHLNS